MLSFPCPQRFETVRPNLRQHRQACRQVGSWPAHDLITSETENEIPVLVTHTEDTGPYWLRLADFPPEDRPAVRALLHALGQAVRSHALILLPRHFDLIIEQAQDAISEYVTEAGPDLNPQSAYAVACEAGYGGPDPEYLRRAQAEDRATPPLQRVTMLPSRLQRLAHFIQLLDEYAQPTNPTGEARDEPGLGYSGWSHPLGILDPTQTPEEYEWYYEPINESYQHWMMVGEDSLLPRAIYPRTGLNRRALKAWTARHARIMRHAVTVLQALDALRSEPPAC